MLTVGDLSRWLNDQAPLQLSEPWDNTGLLMGDPKAAVKRVLTCLSITESSAREAIQREADLVIAHHPLPFKPLNRITTESTSGRLLWDLARAGVAVYSPHTAWDSAENGINAMLVRRLGLDDVRPLIASQISGMEHLGSGRIGVLKEPASVKTIAHQLSRLLPDCRPRGVDRSRPASVVAVACGSGGSLLEAANRSGCELFITGEATFHTCLEAQAWGMSLLMIGHFASERFSLVELAERLSKAFPELESWACQTENDPVVEFD